MCLLNPSADYFIPSQALSTISIALPVSKAFPFLSRAFPVLYEAISTSPRKYAFPSLAFPAISTVLPTSSDTCLFSTKIVSSPSKAFSFQSQGSTSCTA